MGVSHAAPRTHFPDRRALLHALAQRGFSRVGAELRAAYELSEPRLDQRLRATMTAYVAFARRNAALLELMFTTKPDHDAAAVRSAAADALSVVPRLIEEGVAPAALAPADPDRYALLLAATIRGIVGLVTSDTVESDIVEALIADAAATFIRGNAPTVIDP